MERPVSKASMPPENDSPGARSAERDGDPPREALTAATRDREEGAVIIVRYRVNLAEEDRGLEAHFRRAWPMARRIIWTVVIGAIFAIPFVASRPFPNIPLLWPLAVIAVFWLFWPLLRMRGLKAAISALPEWEKRMELHISPSCFRSINSNTDAILRWAAFPKGLQSRDGFLLYVDVDAVRWIPRGIFADDDEYERAVGWARAGIPDFANLDPRWREAPPPGRAQAGPAPAGAMDPGLENPYSAPEEIEPPCPVILLASEIRNRERRGGISIRYRATPEERRRLLKVRFRHEDPSRKLLGEIAGACLIAAIPIYFHRSFPTSLFLWFLAAFAANSLLRSLLRRRRLRKRFASIREWDKDAEWHLTPSWVHITNTNDDAIIRWGAIRKGLVSDDGLLLSQDPVRTYWLPRRAFADDGEYRRAVNWARMGILNFVELDPGWRYAPAPTPDRPRDEPAPLAGGGSPRRTPG